MIKKEQLITHLSFVAVGTCSILLALWISSSFIQSGSTQEAGQEAPPEAPQEFVPEDNNENEFPVTEEETRPPEGNPAEAGDTDPELQLSEDPALSESAADEQRAQIEKDRLRTEVQSFLEPFIYDPKGRRDPFKPYAEVIMRSEGAPAGPVLPLQRFGLDQLKLVGIIWGVDEPKAMILDPNSRIYTIGRDERIGPNNGYVAAIREGEVVVIETFRQREGDPIYTPRVLRIER